MNVLESGLGNQHDQQENHDIYHALVISLRYIMIQCVLDEHDTCWRKKAEYDGQYDNGVEATFIGSDELENSPQHFEVDNIATAYFFFFHWISSKLASNSRSTTL